MSVAITRLAHGQGLPLPEYRTPGSAGMDLFAAIADDAALAIEPGRWALVPTGLALHLPEGYEGQIRPRSGLALRHGVTVLNAPGTIDADYRGEVGVVLINHAASAFTVTRGMRIAQLVVAPIARVRLEEQDQLAASSRGAKGFGSTGV